MERSDIIEYTCGDDVISINDNIKGIMGILWALQLADDSGQHMYQREIYIALQNALGKSVKDLDDLKTGVDNLRDQIKK